MRKRKGRRAVGTPTLLPPLLSSGKKGLHQLPDTIEDENGTGDNGKNKKEIEFDFNFFFGDFIDNGRVFQASAFHFFFTVGKRGFDGTEESMIHTTSFGSN